MASRDDARHLRLIWPQWQGAGSSSVREFADGLPFEVIRRGYAAGTAVLEAVLPPHRGPEARVPVEMGERGLETRDGVEAKAIVLEQLAAALAIVEEHDPSRITTLGGDCSVSVAPFSHLAARHGDDLAVLWVDSHPDITLPSSRYDGHHAMAVSALTGHGDADVLRLLPATIPAGRVALVGMHDWTDDTLPPLADEWGLSVFGPDALRDDSRSLVDWLASTGASKVAVHLDVDTIDADEARLGLGSDVGGLTMAQARRVMADVSEHADVVAMTIAEYVPRQVLRLGMLLDGLPLLDGTGALTDEDQSGIGVAYPREGASRPHP